MKLSIAWIFDHIKAKWQDVDIPKLVAKFSAITAEVEELRHVQLDLKNFTIVRIADNPKKISGYSTELKKRVTLSERKDLQRGQLYLVKKEKSNFVWASLIDFGSEKEGLMPAISCAEELLKGAWKDLVETDDYIMSVDNKAFTHRPDMWGHRGFAREMAAILHKELLPEELFLAAKPIKHYTSTAPVSATNPFTITLEPAQSCGNPCKRLAALYLPQIDNCRSSVFMAHRLARIDGRPLDFIVDTTNYVMFDLGQPVHAFDAKKIETHMLVGRCARDGEMLSLLDSQEVTLKSTDYVITNGKKPLALAGIMGGQETAITEHTHSLLVESANFEPTVIRKTSTRIKKRTEASTRFEKSLDPNQNTQALLRFLKILDSAGICYQSADAIASVGPLAQEAIISVHHALITARIGVAVSPEKIHEYLTALGFGIQDVEQETGLVYHITVPTYRGTKDITIPEDIIEEIARFVGYNTIPHVLPTRIMAPFDTHALRTTSNIKHLVAYALAMHELQTYPLFDEEFLKLLHYDPKDSVYLANSFSEQMQRLVTSLVPHLLKALLVNSAKEHSLRFFELNRVWFQDEKIVERYELAGIFFEHKKAIDFYAAKAELNKLFAMLKLDISWGKPTQVLDPWYNSYQTAELRYKDRIIGTAGMASKGMLDTVAQGNAFIFELDADFLLSVRMPIHQLSALPKYQEVHLDFSLLIPASMQVAELEKKSVNADQRIKKVELIDFYEKEEWPDQKSVTIRFTILDEHKTLVKEEIEAVSQAIAKTMRKLGAIVR